MRYLFILAVAPTVLLLIYIYKKDKASKEPAGLLAALFFSGAGSCIPAILLELAYSAVFSPDGSVVSNFFQNFFGVALVEESCKFIFVFLITRKNRNFNSYFDGIIYCVFASLGFATLENIIYVFSYGASTALLRAVTSIPGHMFFAIIMGAFYSEWKIRRDAKEIEHRYYSTGVIQNKGLPEIGTAAYIFSALALATIAHGIYDFLLSFNDSNLATMLFILFIIALYVVGFSTVRIRSKKDAFNTYYINAILFKRHPELPARLVQIQNMRAQQAWAFSPRFNANYAAPSYGGANAYGNTNTYTAPQGYANRPYYGAHPGNYPPNNYQNQNTPPYYNGQNNNTPYYNGQNNYPQN